MPRKASLKGGDYIPLYTQTTSNNWGENKYSINLDAGINEYTFGRPTYNNQFMVASELVKEPNHAYFEMATKSNGIIGMIGAGRVPKKAPKKPVASTPKKPVASTPKKPVASAPKKPVASTPKKPVASTPASRIKRKVRQ